MSAGFVFYTNKGSQKGQELDATAKAALVFHWKSLNRQVRVRGAVEHVTDAEADAYFATRPKQAQIGAWASKQSHAAGKPPRLREGGGALPPPNYAIGTVPRPPQLVGLSHRAAGNRVLARPAVPPARPHRVHARRRQSAPWSKTRLYP